MFNVFSGMLQAVAPLIFACILNVSGVATFEVYNDDAIVIQLVNPLQGVSIASFSYGGFIFNSHNKTRFYRYLINNGYQNNGFRQVMLIASDKYLNHINHEYGHTIQQRKYGSHYFGLVAVPSFLTNIFFENHSEFPWETEATLLGKNY